MYMTSKMKQTLILYAICVWYVKVTGSSHFRFEKHGSGKLGNNGSIYMYQVERDTSTKSSTSTTHRNRTGGTESPSTEATMDICNVGNITERRRKRFIYYLTSYTTPVTVTDTSDFSILSEEFLNCTHTRVEPECYQMLSNGSVYVPVYKRYFDKTNYVINQGLLFVCPHFFDQFEEKFPSNIATISIVGVSISTVCIILHMIMFCLVENLRSIHGYCLFSLCISLLITYMMSFIQMRVNDYADCKAIGLFMMYSLLSSFFWMNVVSFDVWHAVRLATSKLMLISNQSILIRFFLYSCYAWGMPILVILLALLGDNVVNDPRYQLIFRRMTCWFQYKQALLLYFALPVFILLVLNIIFFATSFLMISRSRSNSGSREAYTLRSQLFMSLRLGSAMGLVWIFGLLATATQKEWIYYLHSLSTALQGVFIFFSFSLTEKTQKACRRAIKSRKMSNLTESSNQTKF